jgi:hypothetical protein
MGALIKKTGLLVSEYLLGSVPRILAVNRKVAKRIRKLSSLELPHQDPRASVSLEKVRKHHENELSRRKILEDKAKTNVTAVTIAVSVLFSGLTMLGNEKLVEAAGTTRIALIVALVFCVANFVLGGLFAMWVLQVGPLYSISLSQELLEDKEQVVFLLRAIELNQLETTARYNWLTASYYCIRNAVFTLSVFVVIAAAHLLK